MKTLSEILKDLSNYYKRDKEKLVHHLYTKGYTYRQVGDILGVSPQAVEQDYPKSNLKGK